MRVKLLSFILCIVFSSFLFGQGATNTTSSAEKFNRRGYLRNDAITKNDHEVISDFDGNLMLHYSTPVDIPHDLGSDFTITYNPNVEHRYFAPLLNNMDTGGNIYFYNMGIPVNSAEWILGYKGFALQTLNFEVFHYADQTITKPEYVKKEVPLLIPGYTYGNFDGAFNNSAWGSVYRDYITILRADGSKMVLRNAEYFYGGTQSTGATAYTGLYVEEGNESKGFALVTFDSGDGSPVERRKRIIEYRSGDGLVYTFLEMLCSFSDPSYTTNKKVIYLSKITNPAYKSDDGFVPKVTFNYANSLDIIGGTLSIFGRKIFTGMTYTPHLSSLISQIDMDWTYNSYGYFSGIKTINHTKGESIKLSVEGLSFNNALSYYRYAVKGRSIFPTKIQLMGETSTTVIKEDVLSYYTDTYGKPASSRKYWYESSLGANFYYQDSTYLPKSIVYQSKQKSEFEFWPSSFDGNTYAIQLAMGEQFCASNMNIAKRDCYTNYMIKNRKTYNYLNSAYVQTKLEDYTYGKGPNKTFTARNGTNYTDTNTGTMKTTINLTSYQSDVPEEAPSDVNSKTIRKYFNYFPTSFTNFSANFDAAKISKLTKEVVYYSSTDSLTKEYTYDWGNYTAYPEYSGWNYFDGSFALKSVKETEYHGSASTASLKSTNYSYNTVNYGCSSFAKAIVNYEISKDTSTLYNYRQYYNVINISSPPSSVTYNSYNSAYPDYYKIGLPSVDKVYGKATPGSSENVISHKTYSYSTATNLSGSNWEIKNLLHQVNDNAQSSRLASTVLWYNSVTGTSSYATNSLRIRPMLLENSYPAWPWAGSLRQTVFPKGAAESLTYVKFYYTDTPAVTGIVVPYSASNYNVSKTPVFKQYKPWQRTIAFDNTSLVNTTSYDAYGNIEAEIDVNGYFQGYLYDNIQRLTTAAFPGSFYEYAVDEPNPMLNTAGSVLYTYYDNLNKIHGQSNMDFSLGKSFEFEDQYDALGNIKSRSEKNDNSSLEQLNSKFFNGFDLPVGEASYAVGTSQKVSKYYGYDYLGRITAAVVGNSNQTYAYTIETGSFSRGSYTVNYVRKTTVTDAESKSVVTYFDQVGKKVAEKIGTNDATLFVYNEAYQLTNVVTPEGKVTSYTYDELGFLSAKTSADEGTYNYKYSKYGELRYQFHTTQTPATLLYHNYDKLGRLEATGTRSITSGAFSSLNPDANSSDDNTAANMTLVNVYDNISYIGSAYYSAVFSGFSLPAGVTLTNIKGKLALTAYRDNTSGTWSFKAYSYDYAGRVANVYVKDAVSASPTWKTIANSFDHMENLTQQVADNFRFRYEYDNRARLKKVYTKASSESAEKNDAEYVYNVASQITQQKLPSAPNGTDAINYTYDYSTATYPQGWLTTINNTNPSTSTVRFNEGLTYFANGNVNTQAITNLGNGSWTGFTYTFGYDAMNRINSAGNTTATYGETYSYNQDGGLATKVRNGATTSYAYVTGTHKLSTAGSGSFTYDYKGNVTADGFSNVTLTSYDFRNLPTAMTTPSGSFTYKYNDGGNRMYKDNGTVKDYYLYDHTGRALLIYDMNTGNLKTANIYGSGLIGRVDLSGGATGGYYERLYYVKDHLGSTRVTISTVETSNQNIAFASDYYPFGETLRDYQVGTKGGKYKFTEKERDAESSYDYFGARYYNNKLGVWLSADPLGGKYPGLSGYVYVRNNPLLRIDPDGLTDIKIEVKRIQETKKSTIGELKISNSNNSKQVNGVTLELPWKNNENKISRIKSGEYDAKLGKSGNDALNKYGGVIRLEDKDNRDGILMHAGNDPKDTHGCILVGSEVAGDDKISGSGKKLTEILKYVGDIVEQDKKNKEKTTITVIVTDDEIDKKERTEKEKK